MLLVDWMLPGGESGLELCKWNERHWGLPFIMVTAIGDELDKVLALELGADDYLTKPFGLRELSARIKAVLRRTGKGKTQDEESFQESLTSGYPFALLPVVFAALLLAAIGLNTAPARAALAFKAADALRKEAH